MADLYEDSVSLIIRLLREALEQGPYKFTFYDGDPDLIPKFNLPAIVVEQLDDTTEGGTFGEDDIVDNILVRVVFDKSDDWDNQADTLNMTHRKVRDVVAGRDLQTGRYLPTTVKGALRPEVYGPRRIGHQMSVNYGPLTRPENVITNEGHVTVSVLYSVDVEPVNN